MGRGGVGHHFGHGEPLRGRPSEALHVVHGEAVEFWLLADRAVQVKEHQPGFCVVDSAPLTFYQGVERLLAAFKVCIGKRNHRLVYIYAILSL